RPAHRGDAHRGRVEAPVRRRAGGLPGRRGPPGQVLAAGAAHRPGLRRQEPGLRVPAARGVFLGPARLRAPFEAMSSLVAPPSLLSPDRAGALWLAGQPRAPPAASTAAPWPGRRQEVL